MTKLDQLDAVMQRQNGILRTADIRALGCPDHILLSMSKSVAWNELLTESTSLRIHWGRFFIIQSRWPQAVFSHEAALYLWGLAEREPLPVTVTLKAGYNATNLTSEGIKVYKVKPELYVLGRTKILSPGGHLVTAYDAERSVCDLFRSRSQVEAQDLHAALQSYFQQKKRIFHSLCATQKPCAWSRS